MPLLAALFDLNGTATRKQALRVFLVFLLTVAVLVGLGMKAPDMARFAFPVLGVVTVWWWATVVRRLHDAGHSGAWAVLMVVPLAGLLVSFAALMLRQDRPFNDSHSGLRAAGTLGLVLVALFYASRLFWAPYSIPAESMKPTLLVGDYLIVRHLQAEDLQRGDVVVFRHPIDDVAMIKRLIALPGDVVQMVGGVPVVNGTPLVQMDEGQFLEPYAPQGPASILPRCRNSVVGVGGICEKTVRRERSADGRSYLVANIEDGAFADETAPFTVPEGHLFFLGDNRDNSIDSRFAHGAGGLGFVAAENVIGRASRVIFSSAGAHAWAMWDWRGDRIFRAVE